MYMGLRPTPMHNNIYIYIYITIYDEYYESGNKQEF